MLSSSARAVTHSSRHPPSTCLSSDPLSSLWHRGPGLSRHKSQGNADLGSSFQLSLSYYVSLHFDPASPRCPVGNPTFPTILPAGLNMRSDLMNDSAFEDRAHAFQNGQSPFLAHANPASDTPALGHSPRSGLADVDIVRSDPPGARGAGDGRTGVGTGMGAGARGKGGLAHAAAPHLRTCGGCERALPEWSVGPQVSWPARHKLTSAHEAASAPRAHDCRSATTPPQQRPYSSTI